MKTPKCKQPKELSDAEFEAALHAVLRDEGYLFPCNEEEVASLRASMDLDGVPTPDTEKFRQLLRQTAQKVVDLSRATRITSHEVDQDLEKLAMVARNGGKIADDIRNRMDADRASSKEQVQKNNGTH